MAQLAVGLLIPLVWIARDCWDAADYWTIAVFNAALLMAAVLTQLYDSVTRR